MWKGIRAQQNKLGGRLPGAEAIRIVGAGTDLTFSVKGRPFLNDYGTVNMSGGELYAAPVEDSVEGIVEYEYPSGHADEAIRGIRLVFRKGRVVEATSKTNQKAYLERLNTTRGLRRVGEFGIGTNAGMKRFTNNILFNEKMGGTIQLALGYPCPGCQGANKSTAHWDMMKDLRTDGAIHVDGRLFQECGRFR